MDLNDRKGLMKDSEWIWLFLSKSEGTLKWFYMSDRLNGEWKRHEITLFWCALHRAIDSLSDVELVEMTACIRTPVKHCWLVTRINRPSSASGNSCSDIVIRTAYESMRLSTWTLMLVSYCVSFVPSSENSGKLCFKQHQYEEEDDDMKCLNVVTPIPQSRREITQFNFLYISSTM